MGLLYLRNSAVVENTIPPTMYAGNNLKLMKSHPSSKWIPAIINQPIMWMTSIHTNKAVLDIFTPITQSCVVAVHVALVIALYDTILLASVVTIPPLTLNAYCFPGLL